MRRRDFIVGIGLTSAWPFAARAEQRAMPVIGFLHVATLESYAHLVAAFRQGLTVTGFVEGQNVAIDYRN
jgi:putative tryptophan/tyrosine transport system substrate-binding protein